MGTEHVPLHEAATTLGISGDTLLLAAVEAMVRLWIPVKAKGVYFKEHLAEVAEGKRSWVRDSTNKIEGVLDWGVITPVAAAKLLEAESIPVSAALLPPKSSDADDVGIQYWSFPERQVSRRSLHVRRDDLPALRARFECSNENGKSTESEGQAAFRPASGEHYVSKKLALLNEAAAKFWMNADPEEPDTQRRNSDVAKWLRSKGYSPSLADRAASIVRPEWARNGRPPQE